MSEGGEFKEASLPKESSARKQGEFKKRVHDKSEEVETETTPMPIMIETADVLAIVVEAAKEFPQYEPLGSEATNAERTGNCIKTILKTEEWFVRWFGKQ